MQKIRGHFGYQPRGVFFENPDDGHITPEELQNMMAGGQELATLEASLGGTV